MPNHKLSTVFAAVAATIAVAAPVAQAAPARPDDRGVARGTAVAIPDLSERAIEHQARTAFAPDAVDRALTRLRIADVRVAPPASSPEAGFNWAAAGIGASTASLLFVLAATGFATARHVRTRSMRAS